MFTTTVIYLKGNYCLGFWLKNSAILWFNV